MITMIMMFLTGMMITMTKKMMVITCSWQEERKRRHWGRQSRPSPPTPPWWSCSDDDHDDNCDHCGDFHNPDIDDINNSEVDSLSHHLRPLPDDHHDDDHDGHCDHDGYALWWSLWPWEREGKRGKWKMRNRKGETETWKVRMRNVLNHHLPSSFSLPRTSIFACSHIISENEKEKKVRKRKWKRESETKKVRKAKWERESERESVK